MSRPPTPSIKRGAFPPGIAEQKVEAAVASLPKAWQVLHDAAVAFHEASTAPGVLHGRFGDVCAVLSRDLERLSGRMTEVNTEVAKELDQLGALA